MYNREDRDRGGRRQKDSEDVHAIPVRAGKRTYFFDVKATKDNSDFFLNITESKRHSNSDGSFSYEKHKIYLYKEDFDKFKEGLEQAITYIAEKCFGGTIPLREEYREPKDATEAEKNFSGGEFEYLQ